ncbi:MAG: glycosyltransferase [Verrucomicrobiota bacterium]
MKWSLISAVNNDVIAESCLLRSPGIQSATDVILQKGFPSAAAAYNSAIQKTSADILVFAHQDMYFPEGWIDSVIQALEYLSVHDPNWGVLGVWGALNSEDRAGYLYWTGGLGMENPFSEPTQVSTLDEVVLITRKSSGLLFDNNLPGYHLYGTDLCLEAACRGMKSYAISAFCIHNTDIGNMLPVQFWRCYLYMRRKWIKQLPIYTPCTQITRACGPMFVWNILRLKNVVLRRHKIVTRVGDPSELYIEISSKNKCAESKDGISLASMPR